MHFQCPCWLQQEGIEEETQHSLDVYFQRPFINHG